MITTTKTTTLRNRIQNEIYTSLSGLGKTAFEAFLALPHIEAWNPDDFLLGELSTVFDVGLPFALIGDNETVAVHKKNIANRLLDKKAIQCSDWSEVQVGALFCGWNGQVSFLPEKETPTSDLEVRWADGPALSVEVTRAETRATHKAVKDAIEHLSGAIRPSDFDSHLVCFIANAANSDDLDAVLDAAMGLKSGKSKQVYGRWAIHALPLDRREDIIGGKTAELLAPTWWPTSQPEYFSISSTLSSNSSVVHLRSLFPETSYINPVMRKASSRQRRTNCPYLIALDVSQLPGAHDRIINDLDSYFSIWNHVSGVMMFQSSFPIGIRQKSWIVSLHVNRHAAISLPTQLASLADAKRQSINFELVGK